MAPIAALLLEKGLSLLGNAVLAKGEQVIEQQLGVKLTPTEINEHTIELKRLEIQHEEFLLQVSMEEEERKLKEKAMDLQDVEGARGLGKELSKSASFLNQNIMPILALFTVGAGFSLLIFNKDIDVRMAAVSMMTMVLGYFFGSSKSSHAAQEFIRSMKK